MPIWSSFSVLVLSFAIQSNTVFELTNASIFTSVPNISFTMSYRKKLWSNSITSARTSATKTEWMMLLHLFLDKLIMFSEPFVSIKMIRYPNWLRKLWAFPNAASLITIIFKLLKYKCLNLITTWAVLCCGVIAFDKNFISWFVVGSFPGARSCIGAQTSGRRQTPIYFTSVLELVNSACVTGWVIHPILSFYLDLTGIVLCGSESVQC